MRRVGFQLQVKKDRIAEYKEVHRNVWPEVCAALTRHGWHRYSLFVNEEGLVFGYFGTEADFATALAGFLAAEATQRWGEACTGRGKSGRRVDRARRSLPPRLADDTAS